MGVTARKRILSKPAAVFMTFTLLCVSFLWQASSFAATAMIPMQYRTAAEALPMVQQLLSPEGRAVADGRTNALLVVDSEETIQRVREFLEGFDKPGKQARIRVRFEEASARDRSTAQGRARASGEDWSVGVGKPMTKDGVDVRLQDRSRTQQGSSEFFVTVVSGSPAYIMVGQDIIYNQRWIDLTRRYARITESVTIQRIETGFEVKPVILKDHAGCGDHPQDFPRGAGVPRDPFYRSVDPACCAHGSMGDDWGTSQQSNEVIRAVLEAGRGERSSVTSISLLVESGN